MITPSTRLATPQFLLLWSATFAFFFSFYLLLPTLPLYAQRLGIAESEAMGFFGAASNVALALGPAVGVSVAERLGFPVLFAISAVIGALALGLTVSVSDRTGRAPVTAAGMLLAALALAGLAFSGELTVLVLVGALYGIGFGAAHPSLMAWTVDRVSPEERGKAMGTFYTAWELGIGTGAIGFGFLLSASSFPAMFAVAAGLVLLGGGGALAQLRR